MRACVQRVQRASVTVDEQIVGQIDAGLLVLLGVGQGDTIDDARYLAEKTASLRIFEDDGGKMNRSLVDISGEMLVVSQFTLMGDVRRGRRPSFVDAAPPDVANELYEQFARLVEQQGVGVERGQFRVHMAVSLVNDGPVTILLDSKKRF